MERDAGVVTLQLGEITFAVMARSETNDRVVASTRAG
jgi:pyruvoyl-dependent arginine decarboxylase (PvlArgDC)